MVESNILHYYCFEICHGIVAVGLPLPHTSHPLEVDARYRPAKQVVQSLVAVAAAAVVVPSEHTWHFNCFVAAVYWPTPHVSQTPPESLASHVVVIMD